MKTQLIRLFFFFLVISTAFSQKNSSPYTTHLLKDGAWITAGIGLDVLGASLIRNKKDLSLTKLNSLSKKDIWGVDRWAAGYFSDRADKESYIPMFGSFVLPFALLFNKNERSHAGQISVLFIETMATTGAMYTITAGLVQKSRPLVYNEDLPTEKRISNNNQRSFFAGHTAATAAATFFAAKVFHDFNPDSPLQPYIWGVAAAIPVTTAYLRVTSGNHFLTDNLVGYILGAASGILIPELHKKQSDLSVYPVTTFYQGEMNFNSQGMGMTYKF